MELLRVKKSVILVPLMEHMAIAVPNVVVLFVAVANAKNKPIPALLTTAATVEETVVMLKSLKMPHANLAMAPPAVVMAMRFAPYNSVS